MSIDVSFLKHVNNLVVLHGDGYESYYYKQEHLFTVITGNGSVDADFSLVNPDPDLKYVEDCTVHPDMNDAIAKNLLKYLDPRLIDKTSLMNVLDKVAGKYPELFEEDFKSSLLKNPPLPQNKTYYGIERTNEIGVGPRQLRDYYFEHHEVIKLYGVTMENELIELNTLFAVVGGGNLELIML